jgi:hypothetical protein
MTIPIEAAILGAFAALIVGYYVGRMASDRETVEQLERIHRSNLAPVNSADEVEKENA